MPVVSKAQNAAMHAAASGNSTLGIPAKVGREFTANQSPGSVKRLPVRKAKMTQKKWEGSPADKRVDKKRGLKEGSAKDNAADRQAVTKANRTVTNLSKAGMISDRARKRMPSRFGEDRPQDVDASTA